MTTTINQNQSILLIKNKDDSVIGVDVGLTNWIALSDGQVIDRQTQVSGKVVKENQDSSTYRQGIPHLSRVVGIAFYSKYKKKINMID